MIPNSPEFTGFLTDGSHLSFALVLAGQPKKIFGSVDINEENRRKKLFFKERDVSKQNNTFKQIQT